MKILTCMVTHNRWDYTKRSLASLHVRPSDELIVVDNGSSDGTTLELASRSNGAELDFQSDLPARLAFIWNDENMFPGFACNQGWRAGLETFDAELLHRSDNDIEYLPGWQVEVEMAFRLHPDLALLGILNLHEDRGVQWPEGEAGEIEPTGAVGGNVVIPRRLWDAGLRWSERPWQLGNNEDALMSAAAAEHGTVAMLVRTVANNMAFCRYKDYPDYYNETARLRGIADAEHSV